MLCFVLLVSGTTPTEPKVPSVEDRNPLAVSGPEGGSEVFLQSLAESRLQDLYVKVFLSIIGQHCHHLHLVTHMEFPPDHPVEEVGRLALSFVVNEIVICKLCVLTGCCFNSLCRLLLAVLLKHHDLASLAFSIIEQNLETDGSGRLVKLPKHLAELIRVVHQTKWSLIKVC